MQDWLSIEPLKSYWYSKEFQVIQEKLRYTRYSNQSTMYPNGTDTFKALRLCSYTDCKVVILGQDPYPKRGQANGLAFGILPNCTNIPLSLKELMMELAHEYLNIPFKDYEGLLNFDTTLEPWANQGILLLNTSLTVIDGQINSHSSYWSGFTEALIKSLYSKSILVWVLMGKDAQAYSKFINPDHYILETYHPASIRNNTLTGIRNSNVFKTVNRLLTEHSLNPIEWLVKPN